MYGEDLARETARHLREHIKAYLDAINLEYPGDKSVTLVVPKQIEPASAVGGMITEFDKILPQYGIDILGKLLSADDASLWAYEYTGQINGLVHGGSREAVDYLISRHERAVETFIREHKVLHDFETANFKLIEFAFAGLDFSGAEDVSGDESLWLAGFSINCSWFISESGPDQHGG
jgi:hypothetical protein